MGKLLRRSAAQGVEPARFFIKGLPFFPVAGLQAVQIAVQIRQRRQLLLQRRLMGGKLVGRNAEAETQPGDQLQPLLRLLQHLGRIILPGEGVGQVAGKLLGQNGQLLQAFFQCFCLRAVFCAAPQGLSGLLQQSAGALLPLLPVQQGAGLRQTGGDLSAALQRRPAGKQLLLLSGQNMGLRQPPDLLGQGLPAALLLGGAHGKRPQAAVQLQQGLVFFMILRQRRLQPAEAVQIADVQLLVQQVLPVVLAVNIDEMLSQRLQKR